MKIESQFMGSSFIEGELCDEIVDYFKSYKANAVEGKVGRKNGVDAVDTTIKNSLDMLISDENLRLKYINSLQSNLTNSYVEQWPMVNGYSPWAIVQYPNIQWYPPEDGGYKHWHTERNSGTEQYNASRHLVYMTYLNDVKDGGETEFLYQKLKIKPKKGLSLIWPADWTFTHRGVVAPNEEKMIVTGWFNYV